MNLKINQRILYKCGLIGGLIEGTVLEISPSGEYVKIRNELSNNVFWEKSYEMTIIEALN